MSESGHEKPSRSTPASEADASRYHGKAPDEIDWSVPERQTRAVAEFLPLETAEVPIMPNLGFDVVAGEHSACFLQPCLRYASDTMDEEWKVLAPLMLKPRRIGRPREVDLRTVVNAILYILATGCQWPLRNPEARAATRQQRGPITNPARSKTKIGCAIT
jgi:hypothetical protein